MRSKDRGDGLFGFVHPASNRLKTEGFQYSGYHLLRNRSQERDPQSNHGRYRPQDLRPKEKRGHFGQFFQRDEGIQVGDHVIDKTSKQKLKVVAFAKNAKYGFTARLVLSARIPTQAYDKNRSKLSMASPNPSDQEEHPSSDLASNLMVADKTSDR